ncbi:MAG: hypothetical protein K8S21_12215 [Gemmatimonadetes bacterium]|nr:hypothetical protein [Gemmatimonadota bacterium]
MDRRRFFLTGAALAGAIVITPRSARAATRVVTRMVTGTDEHPKPRPGITAAKVTSREQLERTPLVADAFEAVRAIPQIVDGLRCHCGCAGLPGFYSLLSCFEGPNAMALACPICPGEGRMAARLHKGGATLDEIRAALDAKFG